MRKTLILIATAAAITACGNANASTTPIPQTQEEILREQFALTDQGVGPIRLGMNVKDIPESILGLYNRVNTVETPDVEEYQFFMDDTPVFVAEDEGDGQVCRISLFNGSPIPVKTTSGADTVSRD